MTVSNDLVLDLYAPLSHKAALAGTGAGVPGTPPAWTGWHHRRLRAYTILAGYRHNVARFFLRTTDPDKRAEHREYGDAELLVDQAVAALIGDDQQIVVDNADVDPDTIDDDSDVTADQVRRAADLLTWLQRWADDEQLWQQLSDAEHDAVGLGDGVYTLAWDPAKGRVRLDTYDPGFYFPALDPRVSTVDYPDRVHIAWEYTTDDGRGWLHRITWQLAPITPVVDDRGLPVMLRHVNADGSETFTPKTRDGDVVLPDGRIGRRYPWQPPDEAPSTLTCYMSEATWELGKVTSAQTIDTLNPDAATYTVRGDGTVVRDLDLRFDFIPVVHIRNAGPRRNHFGAALLLSVAQILDDIASVDTDLQRGAAVAGSPPLAFTKGSGTGGKQTTVGPGQSFSTDGDVKWLDTSRNLDALLKLLERLLHRLSENARVPDVALGRIDPSRVEAGIILALAFGPLQTLVRSMRQIRDHKYPLLLRMVARIAMAAHDPTLPTGELPAARIVFGSYLPADKAQAVEMVSKLLAAKAVSTLTAVLMLVEAGFPIDDAGAEVERIQREDFDAAARLFDATGDEASVAARLGLTPPPAPAPGPESG